MAMTPLTFFERTLGSLSQSHGMAAAVSVICSSSLPHASARALGSEISWALAMPALIFGSWSGGQFELFTGTMFLPLNGTSSQASPSLKSLIHPTFVQIWTFFFGTLQKLVYMAECSTLRKFTLNPSCLSVCRNTCAVFDPGSSESATKRICGPLYLPLGKPAAFMYFLATVMSPLGFLLKSTWGPAAPPPSS